MKESARDRERRGRESASEKEGTEREIEIPREDKDTLREKERARAKHRDDGREYYIQREKNQRRCSENWGGWKCGKERIRETRESGGRDREGR